MIDLCLDVVFTHSPELFVKLGRYLMGAQVLNGLRGQKRKVSKMTGSITEKGRDMSAKEQLSTNHTVSFL